MYRLQVDLTHTCGAVKPMHAVNNMPTVPFNRGNTYELLRDAKIPYARLHDTGGPYGGSRYVDIPNVFPNFDADETDPASYDFSYTDALLAGMMEYGVKPFYRLGVTIENYSHLLGPWRILPPKDPHKWARVCEQIIRHYNEGWANGFHYGIEHWEIWCEPDNNPVPAKNHLWHGTKEQFFELYEIASKHLKRCFPHLKIGGYGSCGFYALGGADVSEVAQISPRKQYFVEFFEDFLRFASERACPLDFFSWHSYGNVRDTMVYATYPRKRLDAYGFRNTEIYLNEWNTGIADRGTVQDAVHIAAMMCALYDTPTDMMMYYELRYWSNYCGPLNPLDLAPFKAYYPFLAFGKLYELGTCLPCSTAGDGFYALAATDGKMHRVLLVNDSGADIEVDAEITGGSLCGATMFLLDKEHDLEKAGSVGETLLLAANTVALIEI